MNFSVPFSELFIIFVQKLDNTLNLPEHINKIAHLKYRELIRNQVHKKSDSLRTQQKKLLQLLALRSLNIYLQFVQNIWITFWS